jgi:hypothetical protein
MPNPGDPISLTSEQRTALGHEVCELIIALESENRDLISDKPIHRDWYNATPDVPERTSPWRGASNLVVPFIRTMADSLIARAVLTTFATNKLWTGSSENSFYRERLTNLLAFLNYGYRHGFDCFNPIHDFITELYIHGHAVMQQVWETSQREVVAPNAKTPVTVSLGRGPRMRFCASEYCLYDRENPISEAEIIVLQNSMSWAKLTREARYNGWDKDSVSRVEDQQGLEGSAAQVRSQKRKQLGLSGQAGDIRLEPHDIRQVWLDWPLFKSMSTRFNDIETVNIGDHSPKAITVPIVVTVHRKTKDVLHAVYNPYLLPEWPFYEGRYRNTDSRGLAKILEHIQRGMTTAVNQGIDAVTMGNSVKFVTRDSKLRTHPYTPNQPIVTDDIEGFRELTGQKGVFPEISLTGLLQAIGERVGGQSDPNFGRETRMGGHPQPATNFLGQQANSQVLNTLPMKSIRQAIGKMGEHRTILYQQFEENRDGWINTVFDEDDGEQIWEALTSDQVVTGQIRFDVHALSELHNPDAERQKTILIDQVYTNYITTLAKMLELKNNPQASDEQRALMDQAVAAKGDMIRRILESSDIDNIEDYVFELQEAQNSDLNQLRQLIAGVRGNPQDAAGGPEGPVRERGLAALPGGAEGGAERPNRAAGGDQLFG